MFATDLYAMSLSVRGLPGKITAKALYKRLTHQDLCTRSPWLSQWAPAHNESDLTGPKWREGCTSDLKIRIVPQWERSDTPKSRERATKKFKIRTGPQRERSDNHKVTRRLCKGPPRTPFCARHPESDGTFVLQGSSNYRKNPKCGYTVWGKVDFTLHASSSVFRTLTGRPRRSGGYDRSCLGPCFLRVYVRTCTRACLSTKSVLFPSCTHPGVRSGTWIWVLAHPRPWATIFWKRYLCSAQGLLKIQSSKWSERILFCVFPKEPVDIYGPHIGYT